MNTILIGNYLQSLRKEKNLTQQEIADIFNISSKTVSKWECGDAIPSINTLINLAKFYGVSVDQILNGGETNFPNHTITSTNKSDEIVSTNKAIKQFTLFYYISLVFLIISYVLSIILMSVDKKVIALSLGIPFLVISLFIILIARNRATIFESELKTDENKRLAHLKFKLSYIFSIIFLFVLASFIVFISF